jgi:ribonuclease P protein component
VSGAFFVLFGQRGATSSIRIGITATRELGSAVARNRIKRVVREIFRRRVPASPTPLDVVINVRTSALTASYQRLSDDLVARFSELRRRIGT